jgi:hypothetical protein
MATRLPIVEAECAAGARSGARTAASRLEIEMLANIAQLQRDMKGMEVAGFDTLRERLDAAWEKLLDEVVEIAAAARMQKSPPVRTELGSRALRPGEIDPLPPIIPLPKDWLKIRPLDDGRHVLIGAWGRLVDGELSTYWVELDWLDFPNPLAGLADLERLGVYDLYLAAVRKFVHGPFEILAEMAVNRLAAE